MGSTVSTNKSVTAFESNGKVFYVLFEETYEKNVYPHTPHWGAVAVGDYAQVLEWVFLAASCCEGGLTQTRRGPTTPERYITAWQTAFSRPVRLENRSIKLHTSGWRAPVSDVRLGQAIEVLRSRGFLAVADGLEKSGTVEIELHRDIEVLTALRRAGVLCLWAAVSYSGLGLPDSTLAPHKCTPKGRPPSLPRVIAYRLTADFPAVSFDDEPLYLNRSAVEDFVRYRAHQIEIEGPGSYLQAIPWLRNVLEAAPMLPRNTRITVDLGASASSWTMERFAKKVGISVRPGVSSNLTTVQFTLAEVLEKDAVWALNCLPPEAVRFDLPECAEHLRMPIQTALELA